MCMHHASGRKVVDDSKVFDVHIAADLRDALLPADPDPVTTCALDAVLNSWLPNLADSVIALRQRNADPSLLDIRRHLSLVHVPGDDGDVGGTVCLVNWLNAATRVGQEVVLDASNAVKWSVATAQQFPYKSFRGCPIVWADCGVAMRRT